MKTIITACLLLTTLAHADTKKEKAVIAAAHKFMEQLGADNEVYVTTAVSITVNAAVTPLNDLDGLNLVLVVESPACSYHFSKKFYNKFLVPHGEQVSNAYVAGFACINSGTGQLWGSTWN